MKQTRWGKVMFELTTEESQPKFTRHQILCEAKPLSYKSVLELWRDDQSFREFHNQALADSTFDGFRWETPALTNGTVSRPYEFVLVNTPGFCRRKTDPITFRKKFREAGNETVIAFPNLGRNATMIVPTPEGDVESYGHLAAFVRNAPGSQIDRLWQLTGETVLEQIGDNAIWLSTAGGGVAWLHVRIDSTPKYYNYAPYKKRPV